MIQLQKLNPILKFIIKFNHLEKYQVKMKTHLKIIIESKISLENY